MTITSPSTRTSGSSTGWTPISPAMLTSPTSTGYGRRSTHALRRSCRVAVRACNRDSLTFASRGRERQVVVDEADRGRAIAHGGGHTFHRAVPDVADGEHARDGGLQQERRPMQGPVLTGVGSGENESPLVALDSFG